MMRETWPEAAAVVNLERVGAPLRLADKLAFGARIVAGQVVNRPQWILFAHLGLSRVLRVVPTGFRTPYAVFLHGIEAWETLDAADLSLITRASLRLCNSDFTAQRAAAANPGIGDIVTCPLALPDVPERPPARPPLRPIALVVGRMETRERYKGHEELIGAWPGVLEQVPDATLVLAGDGNDRPRLEALAKSGRAADRIVFTGFLTREALNRWYADAGLFALPSRGEGFGLVYLEAMQHALPCLGSICDAAREVIVDGETGLLVDPADRGALVRDIVRLLTDAAFNLRCGAAGFARLQSHFSYARFKRQVLGEIDRVLERPVGGPLARQAVL